MIGELLGVQQDTLKFQLAICTMDPLNLARIKFTWTNIHPVKLATQIDLVTVRRLAGSKFYAKYAEMQSQRQLQLHSQGASFRAAALCLFWRSDA